MLFLQYVKRVLEEFPDCDILISYQIAVGKDSDMLNLRKIPQGLLETLDRKITGVDFLSLPRTNSKTYTIKCGESEFVYDVSGDRFRDYITRKGITPSVIGYSFFDDKWDESVISDAIAQIFIFPQRVIEC